MHEITWWDLDFDRVAVPFLSTAGVPQTKWVKVGMPYIPPSVIRGVFYLYRSVSDADAGRNPGGTGFIVRFDGTFTDPVPGRHFYAVTNWHVACKRGFSTMRLNKKDGGTDSIELNPDQWFFLPGQHDVAVAPITLDENVHDVSSISTNQFLETPDKARQHVGVGDDVFMVGLFIDHDGISVNVPSARFGNISMLPNPKAKIKQPTNYMGESFVVDMHSRTGFSGSPVYVYRTFGGDLTEPWGTEFDRLEIDHWPTEHIGLDILGVPIPTGPMTGRIRARTLFALLGIHWGQFPERWELRDKSSIEESRPDLIVEGGYVEGMSGMTCVIPAWQIMEVFNMPALKELRHPGIVAARKAAASQPKPESAADPSDSSEENPQGLEDFRRLVDVAARKRPQGD